MSELLNALNPRIAKERARRTQQQRTETAPLPPHPPQAQDHAGQQPSYQASPRPSPRPPPQQPRNHGSYSSELELAMVAPGPSSRPSQPLPTQAIAQVLSPAHVQGVNMMQEIILKVLAPSQERELHRRLAWEQEQEARTAQRQADLEKQLMEMRQEMSMMRAYIASMSQQQPPPQWHVAVDQPAVPLLESTARVEEMPPPSGDPHSMLQSPLTPASQTVYISPPLPAFVQGSSSRPMAMPFSPPSTSRHSPRFLPTPGTPVMSHATAPSQPSPSHPAMQPPAAVSPHLAQRIAQQSLDQQTALPSPMQTPVFTPAQPPASSARRKRRTPPPTGNQDSDSESSDSETEQYPKRRKNGHDARRLTIHAAMRAHIYRSMGTRRKDPLPDAHMEGAVLRPGEPVRFVWQRTVKQSPHNARMRARIIADIKAQRQTLYPDIVEEEFDTHKLENVFDQAFKTMRGSWRAQDDNTVAMYQRVREETKAQKSRRRERKKAKLKRRTERRKNFDSFAHETFSPALTVECMSSEESGDESAGGGPDPPPLRVRGLAWRSSRLLHFYAVLDADDVSDELFEHDGMLVHKPRRLPSRKGREAGPPKDGLHLPPEGVARWMVSRRWIDELRHAHPDKSDGLEDRIMDYSGFDWDSFPALGGESGDEFEHHPSYLRAPNIEYTYMNTYGPPA